MSDSTPTLSATVMTTPVEGMLAPDFELTESARPDRRLSDLRGSPVILIFHSSQWDPARSEYVAAYNRVIASFPGVAGARLLSIAERGPWRDVAFADDVTTFPAVRDRTENAAQLYGIAGRSAVFVIAADGIIRWRHVAGTDVMIHPDDIARALAALDRAMRAEVAAAASAATERRAPPARSAWNWRHFVAVTLGVALAALLTPRTAAATPGPVPTAARSSMPLTLHINGRDIALTFESRAIAHAVYDVADARGTGRSLSTRS